MVIEVVSSVIEEFIEIWVAFKERIIHILEPHCQHCEYDKVRNEEYLKLLIEQQRLQLKEVLEILKPSKVEETEPGNYEPINNNFVPWRVRRAKLEEASRVKVEHDKLSVKVTKDEIDKLEKELDIKENADV